MEAQTKQPYKPMPHHWALFNKDNKQHKYILSLAIQIGWTTIYKGRVQADLTKLGTWLNSPKSAVRKRIKEMTKEELQLTIFQLEQILAKK